MEKKKLELTVQELNVVLFGLQKLPYESVYELIINISSQVQPQIIKTEE